MPNRTLICPGKGVVEAIETVNGTSPGVFHEGKAYLNPYRLLDPSLLVIKGADDCRSYNYDDTGMVQRFSELIARLEWKKRTE